MRRALRKTKIEALINVVRDMNEAIFVRNGKNYSAKTAETFPRRNGRQIVLRQKRAGFHRQDSYAVRNLRKPVLD